MDAIKWSALFIANENCNIHHAIYFKHSQTNRLEISI
uniref:Uncharacterized protein n=1 Tax=Arundo donax TaxID=35708 RepID=A0A0A9CFP3_ARUDO